LLYKEEDILSILKEKKGEGYIDAVIIVLVIILMIALATSVLPIFIKKAKLETKADEEERKPRIGEVPDSR
jgi:flagellar basal body-associated protein FliL